VILPGVLRVDSQGAICPWPEHGQSEYQVSALSGWSIAEILNAIFCFKWQCLTQEWKLDC